LTKLELPASWSAITVRELLDQTSGIPAYTNFGPTDPTKDAFWKTWQPQDIVDLVSSKPLDFAPGTQFEYSNTNYYILGQVVGAVSGEDLNEFLNRRVFRPIGMASTQGYDPTMVVKGRSARYIYGGGSLLNDFVDMDASYYVGDGGIESSVLDLAKWDAALYGDRPLSAATKQAMWTAPKTPEPESMNYGFGWVLDRVNGHRLIWHNGAIAGAMSWMGRFVDDKLTVIVLANLLNLDSMDAQNLQMRALGKGIAGIVDSALKPAAIPTNSSKTAGTRIVPANAALCKTVFAQIVAGTADESMYTPNAAKALFPDRIAQTTALLKSLGAFESFDALAERSQPGSEIVTCRAVFASATLTYDFYLESGTNKIQGIVPKP
jgi:CubicO group peptidase (beta-lactamase class C family)